MKKFIFVFSILLFGFLFFNISSAHAATLYYNNATVDWDWNTLGNWWTNAGFTTPAAGLPTASDDVVIEGDVILNGGPAASVNTMTVNNTFLVGISVTVANGAVFNNKSFLKNITGLVSGSATFNNTSYNYGIVPEFNK